MCTRCPSDVVGIEAKPPLWNICLYLSFLQLNTCTDSAILPILLVVTLSPIVFVYGHSLVEAGTLDNEISFDGNYKGTFGFVISL